MSWLQYWWQNQYPSLRVCSTCSDQLNLTILYSSPWYSFSNLSKVLNVRDLNCLSNFLPILLWFLTFQLTLLCYYSGLCASRVHLMGSLLFWSWFDFLVSYCFFLKSCLLIMHLILPGLLCFSLISCCSRSLCPVLFWLVSLAWLRMILIEVSVTLFTKDSIQLSFVR